jgi:predicted nucleic acid-binding protein
MVHFRWNYVLVSSWNLLLTSPIILGTILMMSTTAVADSQHFSKDASTTLETERIVQLSNEDINLNDSNKEADNIKSVSDLGFSPSHFVFIAALVYYLY